MALFPILEKRVTGSGAVRVRVGIGRDNDSLVEAVFLKFQTDPTEEEVDQAMLAKLIQDEKHVSAIADDPTQTQYN